MSKGEMEVEAALRIFRPICEGVHALHQIGLRHCDLKPHNVLLMSAEGGAKPIVMDLGSAAPIRIAVRSRMEALLLQDRASVECSAPYRAPELFQVPTECVIDARTDVWSLGAILYFIAFGSSPFESEKEGLLTLSILNGTVNFPPDLLAGRTHVAHLIRRMLQADPAKRWGMEQVGQRL
jgi:serine/threonine kinase 16